MTSSSTAPVLDPAKQGFYHELLRQMLLIRVFEEQAGAAYAQGKIGGFCHLYIGQEAVAVGATAALRDAESGDTRVYDTGSKALRERLAADASRRVEELERRLRRRGIDFIHVDAGSSVIEPLIAFFKMREKRIRR